MRLVAVSDTHGQHNLIQRIPEGDVLIHAGDFMNSGYELEELHSFNRWLGEQPIQHRIVCAGNHDRYFESSPRKARELLTNAVYLENSGIIIDGVSFWASPYTPEFLNWSFMYPRGPLACQNWDQMPASLDVLITHGPPCGILDQIAARGTHLGCEDLLRAVTKKKPRIHIFGHIHGGAGTFDNGVTRFVNAAFLDDEYRPLEPAGKVRVIDL